MKPGVTHSNIDLHNDKKDNRDRQDRNFSNGSMKMPYNAYGKEQYNPRSRSNMSSKPVGSKNFGRKFQEEDDFEI